MKLILKESALKIFLYLMIADGMISNEEVSKLNEIGKDIIDDSYEQNKDEIIKKYDEILGSVSFSSEAFDILCEQIDAELSFTGSSFTEAIPSRLLIWNLLVIANADNEYGEQERRLINHIARKLEIDKSVLLEMEQYIKTGKAIESELETLKDSMEPYAIIRPVVDGLMKRQEIIKRCVMGLIEDEIMIPVEKMTVQEDVFDKTAAVFHEKTDPFTGKVRDRAGKILGDMKEAAKPATAEATKTIGKTLSGLGARLMKYSNNEEGEGR